MHLNASILKSTYDERLYQVNSGKPVFCSSKRLEKKNEFTVKCTHFMQNILDSLVQSRATQKKKCIWVHLIICLHHGTSIKSHRSPWNDFSFRFNRIEWINFNWKINWFVLKHFVIQLKYSAQYEQSGQHVK